MKSHRSLGLALAILLLGCAGNPAYEEGLALIEAGNFDAGVAKLALASQQEPDNREYRRTYIRQRDLALQRYLAMAEAARQQGQWDAVEFLYQRMLAIAPGDPRARAGLDAAAAERRHRALLAEAEALLKKDDVAGALAKIRLVLAENGNQREAQQLLRRSEGQQLRSAAAAPQLAAALKRPVTLEFRDATLRQIFELVSRHTGLNFIFDRDVRPDLRATIFVRNSSVEDVLRFILVSNQLERKVLSANTMLIYPNTPAKTRDYQELLTRSFYLANADVKTAASLIRSLVKTKDMHVDEKLNLLVIRDTPDAVRMAERLVAAQDLAEPEVMLEVEVMEIGSNVLYELGLQYPDQVSWSVVGAAGIPGTITLPEYQNRSADLVRLSFNNPLFALNFRNTLGKSNLLANPRIRVKNKEKARVHIGDKVPVITTTTTATGFASESVTYLDIGLKLDVEPAIHLEDDVGIKIGLEVSSIAREIRSTSGTLTYQVGTRNASTTLRLKDGETQVLAGLISDEERKNVVQVPGLGSIPGLGRLFGSHQDTSNKTEIVLLITPRVVRNLVRPPLQFEEFLSGTEAAIGAAPLMLQSSVVPTPEGTATTATPAGAAAGAPRLVLNAPASVPAGQEFEIAIALESETALRSGLLDFAFDPSRLKFVQAEPGALVTAADKEAVFRASAPEAVGRLNLSFSSKGDLKGQGELAKIRFQVIGAAAGAPTIRIEALSFTSAAGKVVQAELPPPVSLSLTR